MYIYIISILILVLLRGLVVFVFDPLEPHGCAFLDLLDAGGSHRFRLYEAFADLLLVLGGGSAVAGAAFLGVVNRVGIVVPLVGPRCFMRRAVCCHNTHPRLIFSRKFGRFS